MKATIAKITTTFVLICCCNARSKPSEVPDLVTQYVNIIQTNITKVFKYQFPESNEDEFSYDPEMEISGEYQYQVRSLLR